MGSFNLLHKREIIRVIYNELADTVRTKIPVRNVVVTFLSTYGSEKGESRIFVNNLENFC